MISNYNPNDHDDLIRKNREILETIKSVCSLPYSWRDFLVFAQMLHVVDRKLYVNLNLFKAQIAFWEFSKPPNMDTVCHAIYLFQTKLFEKYSYIGSIHTNTEGTVTVIEYTSGIRDVVSAKELDALASPVNCNFSLDELKISEVQES